METTILNLTAGTWVEISSSSVQINHTSGGLVIYAASDTQPSVIEDTPVMGSTSRGQSISFSGVQSIIWALAINGDAEIDVTEISSISDTVVKYDGLTQAVSSSQSISMSELYSALGRRYSHKFDLTFTGSEVKYFLYNLGVIGDDVIVAIQERIFKSLNDAAQLEVFTGATGFTAATKATNITSSRPGLGRLPDIDIYNLTDGEGNTEPSDDGTSIDTDFVTGSGSGSNTTGGFSPQTGERFYDEGTSIVVKVTNLDSSANRISLEYSWLELPIDYLD